MLSPVEKLLWALDLHETGVALMRQNLRREHPQASEEEIEKLLVAWLHRRPGAEHGDAAGGVRPRLPAER